MVRWSTDEQESPAEGHGLGRVDAEYAERTRWELAVAAAGIGGFDWDLITRRLSWDERLRELFEYTDEPAPDTIEGFEARLHPDDVDQVRRAIASAIDTCGDYEAEYRVLLPTGRTRWVRARGRALCDEQGQPVRLLGAAYDTTAVQEGEARVARVLESMSVAFVLLDRDWRFSYVNGEAERFLGLRREDLLGEDVWALFPAMLGTEFERNYRGAMDGGEPVAFEAFYPAPLNAWYEVRALPGSEGLSVYFLDVTARREAQEQARRVGERAQLLADVTAELNGTLETEVAVARLARIVVPALADWCIVSLLDDAPGLPPWSRLRDVGWWHVDPARRPVVERYAQLRLQSLDEQSFLARSLHSRNPVVVARDATAAIASVLRTDEARDLLRELDPARATAVPLLANGRILGLLTLVQGEDSAGLSEAEVAATIETAVEVADRAALALDNAQLYQQQRRLAEGLQRSLLTAPPELGHVEVVVSYTPAAEAAQVGGDWYDAFGQGDGSTMLVIGDVVGHDAEAAAGMGQLRGLLRGIAATTGEGPAGVLGRLDAAMELLQVDTTATAVVARLERAATDGDRGRMRLCWSNAGHPPPMLIAADGTVSVLTAGAESDPLLGVAPTSARTDEEITLATGDTVLLYTDGLVEQRGQSLDEGLARLRRTLVDLAGHPLPDLSEQVLGRMLPTQPTDDVALALVRVVGSAG